MIVDPPTKTSVAAQPSQSPGVADLAGRASDRSIVLKSFAANSLSFVNCQKSRGCGGSV